MLLSFPFQVSLFLSCLTRTTVGWSVAPHADARRNIAITTTRLSFVPGGNIPEEILRGRDPDPDAILPVDKMETALVDEDEEGQNGETGHHKTSYHMLGSWHRSTKDPIALDENMDCIEPYFDQMTGDALCWGLFDDDGPVTARALQDAMNALDNDNSAPKKLWNKELPTDKYKPEDNHISYGMMGSWNKPPQAMEKRGMGSAVIEEEDEECEHPYFDQMTGDALCWFI